LSVKEVQTVLEKDKIQRDDEVNAKQKALAKFKRDNVAMANETDRAAVLSKSLGALSEKLTEAQVAQTQADLNYRDALEVSNDPEKIQKFVAALQDNGKLPRNTEADEARQEKRKLEEEKLDLVEKLGPKSPMVLDQDAKIKALDPDTIEADADQRIFKRHFASCAEILDSSDKLVTSLKEKYDQQQQESTKLNLELADYQRQQSDLEADAQRAERLDEQAESKMKAISIGQDYGPVKVQVLEQARPAFEPVRPQKMSVFGIAMGMGLVVGFSGILACDWMDTRMRSPEQVHADMTVPVLGTVPRIPGGKSVSLAGRQVMLDPMSEVAEGFRSIRTALYFGMHDGRARTILVTSPISGEGKTTLVSNLAISMAQAGRRTLILDADFRKPTQHVVFGLSGEVGLSSVLSGSATLADAIHHTDIDRLDVLPCGPIPMNPSESLNSHGFQQLLDGLSDEYDCVLLDSAPVVPVTDARILAAICDLTLLVLRAEQSTRKTSIYARNSLYSVGAEIAGIVLNDVNHWHGAGYSTYGYHSRYSRNGADAEIAADPVIERMPALTRASQIALATPPATKAKIKRTKK
jgi:succinoglycan biosynthesis transport protein ExoP